MLIQPYLFFNGRCEEALAFYEETLGARTLMLMRYADSPEPPPPGMTPENWGAKVMHALVRIGESEVMVSDGYAEGGSFQGFQLAVTVKDEAEADRVFAALSEGGEVRTPLAATFFSPRFGMAADRFGVAWAVIAAPS